MDLREETKKIMGKIRPELKNAWFYEYDKKWMYEEVKGAIMWTIANPSKKPRDWGRFLTNWFKKNSESSLESKRKPKSLAYKEPEYCQKCNGDGFLTFNDDPVTYRCDCAEGQKLPKVFPIRGAR